MHIHCIIYVYIQCIYMYIRCTWVPHIVCIWVLCSDAQDILIILCIRGPEDIPQSCICISVLATETCSDNWLYHVHTVYIHVHTVYTHVHTLYMSTKYFFCVPVRYFPLQTRLYRLQEATYNASVQESAILYIGCS
jgi:hypothetical protein